MTSEPKIRWANRRDMITVSEMIKDLAIEEKMPDGPTLSIETLTSDGFGMSKNMFKCYIVEDLVDEKWTPIGYALFFYTFSPWKGKSILLEDLYVKREHRFKGIGRKLISTLSKHAIDTGCCQIDFNVLNWNVARNFYKEIGAVNLTETQKKIRFRYTKENISS